ncbi:hypothetical protein, partial [Pseudomonas fluorescens]|uniref:hypothetical protein n=1 Tax=Pseudomonas fluorescens TaxID=294 RepID=UPI001CD659C2
MRPWQSISEQSFYCFYGSQDVWRAADIAPKTIPVGARLAGEGVIENAFAVGARLAGEGVIEIAFAVGARLAGEGVIENAFAVGARLA